MRLAATARTEDRYPSRVKPEPSITERQDPVVWGGPDDGPLSAEQLRAFERDGYLELPRVLGADEVGTLLGEMARLCGLPEVVADERTVTEPGSDEVRSIFEVHRRPVFDWLTADPRLAGVARQLLGGDVSVHQSRVNLKPGFRGKEFSWHSDFETWHTEDGMPAMRAVSASVSLTENTTYNGPLMIIPGSHHRYVACVGETPDDHYKASLKVQVVGSPDDASLAQLYEDAGRRITTFTGGAGSVVFFDCNAMHGSSSNISPLPRSNVFLVYNSVENALVEPFAAERPRPTFIAARDIEPLPRNPS